MLCNQDALRVRRSDLENIVDEVSDGEGDEEEGMKARLLLEAAQDTAQTKAVVEALRDGTGGRRKNRGKQGHFNRRELAEDDDEEDEDANGKEKAQDEEGQEVQEEEDLEEKLLEGLRNRHARTKNRDGYYSGEETEDSDVDDEEEGQEAADDLEVKSEEEQLMKIIISSEAKRTGIETYFRV